MDDEAFGGDDGGMTAVETPDLWTTTDPLGEALHALRVQGVFYARSELTAPWGLELPAMPDCLWFHFPVLGHCLLEIGDAEPQLLQAGDFALVPSGERHFLRSEAGARTVSMYDPPYEQVSDSYILMRHGEGGAPTSLVCGAVRVDHPAAKSLLAVLPETIHIGSTSSPQYEWMQSTLRLMGSEASALRPGGEAVITRLADILIIQTIRSWIESDEAGQAGWLSGLRDPQIGRAITAIHRQPDRPWSVASLADHVSMSRSSFAERFTRVVGEPVLSYLTRWRMQVAASALSEGDSTVAELAQRLGYQSEAAFSRAFKRVTGTSPGALRKP